jgi:hypothetical protein
MLKMSTKFHLLRYEVLTSLTVRSLPRFWKNVLATSIESKNKSVSHTSACFLGSLFDPEDGGSMFLPNVGKLLRDYTA